MGQASSALVENYRFHARYNRWFNERLYDACGRLSDEERRRDRRAFFGSIHGSLNHLIWGDCLWLARFGAQGASFASLAGDVLALPAGATHATVICEDWSGLRERRMRLDAAIEQWARDMTADYLLGTMRYSNSRGVARSHPVWQGLTHFFNHQTHHRGQVTALLSQAGVDVGVTDMIALV